MSPLPGMNGIVQLLGQHQIFLPLETSLQHPRRERVLRERKSRYSSPAGTAEWPGKKAWVSKNIPDWEGQGVTAQDKQCWEIDAKSVKM